MTDDTPTDPPPPPTFAAPVIVLILLGAVIGLVVGGTGWSIHAYPVVTQYPRALRHTN